MWLIRILKIGTNALGQFASRQQAPRFHHSPLPMHPLGLDRIEPGTLCGQEVGQNAHALTRLLDLLVMLTNPGAHHLAHMPGRLVQDQEPVALALFGQALTAPTGYATSERRGGKSPEKRAKTAEIWLPERKLSLCRCWKEWKQGVSSGTVTPRGEKEVC